MSDKVTCIHGEPWGGFCRMCDGGVAQADIAPKRLPPTASDNGPVTIAILAAVGWGFAIGTAFGAIVL